MRSKWSSRFRNPHSPPTESNSKSRAGATRNRPGFSAVLKVRDVVIRYLISEFDRPARSVGRLQKDAPRYHRHQKRSSSSRRPMPEGNKKIDPTLAPTLRSGQWQSHVALNRFDFCVTLPYLTAVSGLSQSSTPRDHPIILPQPRGCISARSSSKGIVMSQNPIT